MTILSELYDGDKVHYREDVERLRPLVRIPHPLNGAKYAEGVYMLGYAYKPRIITSEKDATL